MKNYQDWADDHGFHRDYENFCYSGECEHEDLVCTQCGMDATPDMIDYQYCPDCGYTGFECKVCGDTQY